MGRKAPTSKQARRVVLAHAWLKHFGVRSATQAAMSCFGGFLVLFGRRPAPQRSQSPASAIHEKPEEDIRPEKLAVSSTSSGISVSPALLEEPDRSLRDEAFDLVWQHAINSDAIDAPRRACEICGKGILGVAYASPCSDIAHHGCALTQQEGLLQIRERRHRTRCRQQQHKERWAAVRQRRRQKQGPDKSQVQPQNAKDTLLEIPVHGVVVEQGSCWGGFSKWLLALGRSAGKFIRQHRWKSSWEVLGQAAASRELASAEKAASEAERELLGIGASSRLAADACPWVAVCWDALLKAVAGLCQKIQSFWREAWPWRCAAGVPKRRCRKLVQQGSRGAHLARMAAARRGVQLARWPRVRRDRAAHQWAQSSAPRSGLTYAFSIALCAARQVCNVMQWLADARDWLLRREPPKARGADPLAQQRRGRLLAYDFARQVAPTRLLHRGCHACAFAGVLAVLKFCTPRCVAALCAYVVVKGIAARSPASHSANCRPATALGVAVGSGVSLGWRWMLLGTVVVLLLPRSCLWWPPRPLKRPSSFGMPGESRDFERCPDLWQWRLRHRGQLPSQRSDIEYERGLAKWLSKARVRRTRALGPGPSKRQLTVEESSYLDSLCAPWGRQLHSAPCGSPGSSAPGGRHSAEATTSASDRPCRRQAEVHLPDGARKRYRAKTPPPPSTAVTLTLCGLNIRWPFSQLLLRGLKVEEVREYDLGHRNMSKAGEEYWIVETKGEHVTAKTNAITDARWLVYIFVCDFL